MFRGNRGFVAALVGLTAAIAFYLLIGDLSSVSDGIQSEASHRANEYSDDAQSYKQWRCIGLAVPGAEDCNRQTNQTARENQRVELDLAAQQMTAWWTQVMGVAALVGMALSAVGVWLVWTTFAETKEANVIARDAAQRQIRAYLLIERAEISIYPWSLKITPFIKNVGASPARFVELTVPLDYMISGFVGKGEIVQANGSAVTRVEYFPMVPHGGVWPSLLVGWNNAVDKISNIVEIYTRSTSPAVTMIVSNGKLAWTDAFECRREMGVTLLFEHFSLEPNGDTPRLVGEAKIIHGDEIDLAYDAAKRGWHRRTANSGTRHHA